MVRLQILSRHGLLSSLMWSIVCVEHTFFAHDNIFFSSSLAMILNCTVFTLRQLKCCQWAPRPPAFKSASALSSDVKQTGRILLLSLLFPFSHLRDKLNHAASHVTMDSRTVAATHFIWCYVHASKLLQFLRLFVCSWWWWLFWISLVEWLTVITAAQSRPSQIETHVNKAAAGVCVSLGEASTNEAKRHFPPSVPAHRRTTRPLSPTTFWCWNRLQCFARDVSAVRRAGRQTLIEMCSLRRATWFIITHNFPLKGSGRGAETRQDVCIGGWLGPKRHLWRLTFYFQRERKWPQRP